jgi:peptidoglycan hydrolase-like protein with peptidoglycan-binding domain
MARSARPLDEPEPWAGSWSFAGAAAALLGLVARNPTLVGGSTAFLVALSFVSANALWYQPHAHSGAFFATRDLMRPGAPEVSQPSETTIVIERPEQPREVIGDPTVKSVQDTLKRLNFYGGDVDGLYGPATRVAIEAYQSKMGLAVTGTVDPALLDHLGTGSSVPVALPSPAPREAVAQPAVVAPSQPPATIAPDDRVRRIQVGLREFGNAGIDIDGLMGAKTEAGIREFQSLFGLPETGKADAEVYAKMKEIGLIE